MSGLSSVNNMRSFYFDTKTKVATSAKDRMKLIAQLAYGHGFMEGKSGGTGNMAIIGDKLVKFNTKSAERKVTDKLAKDSDEYHEMKEGCDALRQELRKMAFELKDEMDETDLKNILAELGFEPEKKSENDVKKDGTIKKDAGLFTRVTAASVVKKLAEAAAKQSKKTDDFVKNLFNDHTPSYGNSVTAFKSQVAVYRAEVLKDIPRHLNEIVANSYKSGAPSDLLGGIADHFPTDADAIMNWLEKACTLLVGLVPTSNKDESAYETMRGKFNECKEKVSVILNVIKDRLANNNIREKEYSAASKEVNKVEMSIFEQKNAEYGHVEGFGRDLEDYLNELRKAKGESSEADERAAFAKELKDKTKLPKKVQEILERHTKKIDPETKEIREQGMDSDTKKTIETWLKKNLCLMFDDLMNATTETDFMDMFRTGAYRPERNKFVKKTYEGFFKHNWAPDKAYSVSWDVALDKKYDKMKGENNLEATEAKESKARDSEDRLENGKCRPSSFMLSNNEEIKSYEDLLKYGIRAVGQTFNTMLAELRDITFADGTHYPDLTKSAAEDEHEDLKKIRDQLEIIVGTFGTVVDRYKTLVENVNIKVEQIKKLAEWTKNITPYAQKYDKICNNNEDGVIEKEKREEFLRNLADMNDEEVPVETLRSLGENMVQMLKGTYLRPREGTETVFENAGAWINYFPNSETLDALLDDAKEINSVKDFKALVKSLAQAYQTLTTQKGQSIFKGSKEAGLPKEFPLGLFVSPVRRDKAVYARYNQKETSVDSSNNEFVDEYSEDVSFDARVMRASLDCFTRLHEVAVAFGIIDDENGEFSK